jgi:hypothetical protein
VCSMMTRSSAVLCRRGSPPMVASIPTFTATLFFHHRSSSPYREALVWAFTGFGECCTLCVSHVSNIMICRGSGNTPSTTLRTPRPKHGKSTASRKHCFILGVSLTAWPDCPHVFPLQIHDINLKPLLFEATAQPIVH